MYLYVFKKTNLFECLFCNLVDDKPTSDEGMAFKISSRGQVGLWTNRGKKWQKFFGRRELGDCVLALRVLSDLVLLLRLSLKRDFLGGLPLLSFINSRPMYESLNWEILTTESQPWSQPLLGKESTNSFQIE